KDRRGNDVVLRGYEDMRSFVASEFARLDQVTPEAATQEADLKSEYDALIADYGSGTQGVVIPLGITALDDAFAGGLRVGDFVLVAGYAGEGKTTFAGNVVAYQAMLRGYNVLYLTGETLRATVRRRLVARHARQAVFRTPGGLD